MRSPFAHMHVSMYVYMYDRKLLPQTSKFMSEYLQITVENCDPNLLEIFILLGSVCITLKRTSCMFLRSRF